MGARILCVCDRSDLRRYKVCLRQFAWIGGAIQSTAMSEVGKKMEIRFFNILRHRPSFSNFSENTGDWTLIFSIYVEKGCVFGNKWKKSKS